MAEVQVVELAERLGVAGGAVDELPAVPAGVGGAHQWAPGAEVAGCGGGVAGGGEERQGEGRGVPARAGGRCAPGGEWGAAVAAQRRRRGPGSGRCRVGWSLRRQGKGRSRRHHAGRRWLVGWDGRIGTSFVVRAVARTRAPRHGKRADARPGVDPNGRRRVFISFCKTRPARNDNGATTMQGYRRNSCSWTVFFSVVLR